MFAVDRITEDGKKAIVSLFNKSIELVQNIISELNLPMQ